MCLPMDLATPYEYLTFRLLLKALFRIVPWGKIIRALIIPKTLDLTPEDHGMTTYVVFLPLRLRLGLEGSPLG